MAKKKVEDAPVYTSWDEVDEALAAIRAAAARVAKAEAEANELRARADDICAGVADDQKLIKQLEANMKAFAEAKLPELLPAKSKRLNHGTIQFTASTECAVKKGFTIAAALEVMLAPLRDAYDKLVAKAGARFIRLKCEIDKAAALAAYNAGQTNNEKLGALGLEVISKENFGYTLADAKAQPTT
jgi:phage host-nuclease inhibitor protein Gam